MNKDKKLLDRLNHLKEGRAMLDYINHLATNETLLNELNEKKVLLDDWIVDLSEKVQKHG